MPIQFSDMMPVPSAEEHRPFLNQLSKALQLGLGFPRQLQQADLANALKNIELQYAPQMAKADLRLKQAQADEALKRVNEPFGGNLSGPARDAMSLQRLEEQYGKDHPMVKLARRSLESQIAGRESLSNLRDNPLRFASPQQKKINDFERQLKIDNPDLPNEALNAVANAYLNYQNDLQGQPLPPLSPTASSLRTNIERGNSTVALQNQAAALSNTVNALQSIDIEPVKAFAGLKGTIEYNEMKIGAKPRTEDWYAYDTFKNVTSIKIMDDLRKALGTSIVPGYVYETIGKLSNPNDPIWGNPKQVQRRWDTTIEMLERQARNTAKQAKFGATTELDQMPNASKSKINVRSMSDDQLEEILSKGKK